MYSDTGRNPNSSAVSAARALLDEAVAIIGADTFSATALIQGTVSPYGVPQVCRRRFVVGGYFEEKKQ